LNSLVTGYRGFLASHLVRALSITQTPFLTGRTSPESSALDEYYIPPEVLFYNTTSFDSIFHLAAYIPLRADRDTEQLLNEVNVDYTARICKTLHFKKMIFSSSVSVYGASQNSLPFNEYSVLTAQDGYGLSKIKAEQAVEELQNYCIIRFSSLYGPGMKENTMIPIFVNQALDRGRITVFGDGRRMQNYLYFGDAVELLKKAHQSEITGTFLGTDTLSYSNLEVAELVAGATGAKLEFLGEDVMPSVIYNNEFTQQKLQWKPKTTLETGIENYIQWKKKQS
jgi:UDP-glucose 4-epimerase